MLSKIIEWLHKVGKGFDGQTAYSIPIKGKIPSCRLFGDVFEVVPPYRIFENDVYTDVLTGRFKYPGDTKWRDRKSTRLNSSHIQKSRMPSSA